MKNKLNPDVIQHGVSNSVLIPCTIRRTSSQN